MLITEQLHLKLIDIVAYFTRATQSNEFVRLSWNTWMAGPPTITASVIMNPKRSFRVRETSLVVQQILDLYVSGKGPNQIARILTVNKVLNPIIYYYKKYGISHSLPTRKDALIHGGRPRHPDCCGWRCQN